MDEIRTLMDEEIKSQVQALGSIQPGSEEQTAAVKNLTALYEARINDEKLKIETDDKNAERTERYLDRVIRIGLSLVEIGLPLVCYGYWFDKGLKFEETGSIASSMMRNLMTKFKLKK